MKPISFCIATANNEKEYVDLLLRSLVDHTEISKHEILVFVDSDNQNTYELLIERKKEIPNLKICKNETGYPTWAQTNISIMFEAAKNDILCYLQSDMVAGKDIDKFISENMTDESIVLCCARIEPPLHPPGPEKIIRNFGLTPSEFDYDGFNKFVEELQSENRPNMFGHFAPFAIYKKTWFDVLGGFDTQFRCSREDSDFIIRLEQNGLNAVESWNACVYHFTCVSSRGKNWFDSEDEQVKYKNLLQQNADVEELKRFIRKWGFFGHSPRPVYDIGLFIEMDKFAEFSILEHIEPYFTNIYINDDSVTKQLLQTVEFKSSYYANLRWKYSNEVWNTRKHLYDKTDFNKRIQFVTDIEKINNDTLFSIKFSNLVKMFTTNAQNDVRTIMENSHTVVSQYDVGRYIVDGLSIDIRQKNDISSQYKRNSEVDSLIENWRFEFL